MIENFKINNLVNSKICLWQFLALFLLDIKSVDLSHSKELVAVGEHQVIKLIPGARKNLSQMVHFHS